MIVLTAYRVQDTIQLETPASKEPVRKVVDEITAEVDTSLVCKRNSIADITFHDQTNFIKKLVVPGGDKSIITLTDKAAQLKIEKRVELDGHLREGEGIPVQRFNNDISLIILLTSILLLTIVRSAVKNLQPASRFLLLKGVNDSASSDPGVIFHWQITLLNLMSFLVISLFASQAAAIRGLIPAGLSGTLFWFISLLVIIAALTTRHFICTTTGILSGEREVFNEYIVGIYQSYHFAALILFILIVLASYTVFLPGNVFVIAGLCTIGLMYIVRVIRLMLIFINRNISIFYLILYLCALEILPLAIIVRYFSQG